jgi:hypothetical protein
VKHVGHKQHVEVLIRFHQRIHEASFHGMDVVINVTVLEQMPPTPAIVTFDWAA